MFSFFDLTKYVFLQAAGLVLVAAMVGLLIFIILRKLHCLRDTLLLTFVIFGLFLFFYVPQGLPSSLQIPFGVKTFGPAEGPVLPLRNVLTFFNHLSSFEQVADIAHDPTDVPDPIERTESEDVYITLHTKEVLAEVAPGVVYNYWTFDGTVPGPMLRVREGDTVHLTLTNDASSLHHHSIDLHAVTGPGGGAALTNVAPGESKTVVFKALHPGLFVYHCAEPNVPAHMAHGMYGMILVEPENGLSPVDHELYVMQGELYATGALGKRGLQIFDGQAVLDSKPQYIVFNGRTKSLVDHAPEVAAGDTVRLYVGNGGVNLISSFHVIGEVMDRVYPEAAISSTTEPHQNVQTTTIPAGGAAIVEFDTQVPGTYVFVDHALARLGRGAWGLLKVAGEDRPDIYRSE